MIDLAADELGLGPEEIRRRNLIPADAFPYTTPTGATYDTGDYASALDEALRVPTTTTARRAERRPRAATRSCSASACPVYVEITGFGGGGVRRVDVHPDGRPRSVPARPRTVRATPRLLDDRRRPPRRPARDDHLRAVRHRAVPRGQGTGGSRSLQLGGARSAGRRRSCGEGRRARRPMLEATTRVLEVAAGAFRSPASRRAVVAGPSRGAGGERRRPGASTTTSSRGRDVPLRRPRRRRRGRQRDRSRDPLRHVAVDDCGRSEPAAGRRQQHGGVARASRRRCGKRSATTTTATRSPRTSPTTPCRAAEAHRSRSARWRPRPRSTRSAPRASASRPRSAPRPRCRTPSSTR